MHYLEHHPHLIAELHPEKNGSLQADQIRAHTDLWWKCQSGCVNGCEHVWKTNAQNRRDKNSGCPYCAEPARKFCPCNSLKRTMPCLAREWHPTKNGDITPDDVSAGSQKVVWWLCDKYCPGGCPHEYTASIVNRSKERGCPWCASKKI
jgi:hypothetical protein